MPKIETKEPTLNGQAYVIKYAERSCFYLRVNRGNKRYTNISLNTSDIRQAHKNALSAYVKVESDPPKSKTRKLSIDKVCEEYLKEKENDVRRGQLAAGSHDSYSQRIYQRIIPYCRSVGIISISDISKNAFAEYAGFYLDIKTKGKWKSETSGLSTGTINSDLTTLKAIINWMVKKELLDPKKKPEIDKLKDRTNYRDEANPAFLPDDWTKFCSELYGFEKNIKDQEVLWKRRWFIHWVRFQFQSGCRPHETAQILCGIDEKLRRKDQKLTGIVTVSNTSKTGGREVVMNWHTIQSIKSHLTKGIKIRNEQIEVYNKKVLAGEVKDKKGKVISETLPQIPQRGRDDLLMMNPFFENRTTYHMEHIRQWFNRVLSKCEFDRRYTLYSLRATHISFALLDGQRVDLVAKNCGTSMTMIQKTYDGLSSRFHFESLGLFQESVSSPAKAGKLLLD
ncbi:phage integrase SAM-like domain-containing protein [Cyanobium sp. ATX 6F1]|uniref:phage integrase SAM-like domain-containing protein n=1 Tax=unclassified Cyanobium TaxID=2627006 RepID=UPI0020CC165E|nr:phage integrase SAM-like domain-containing protein [Cyanobium sp. ATX 6F1]MCP9916929.1 site-specific integrase [Cyanobium sp. ATX 6F1]